MMVRNTKKNENQILYRYSFGLIFKVSFKSMVVGFKGYDISIETKEYYI